MAHDLTTGLAAHNQLRPADSPSPAVLWSVGGLSLLVLLLWQFPAFWYTKADSRLGHYWFLEQTNVAGWLFREIPVSKSAEAVLVADRLVSGEFSAPDGNVVRVFSAKRYLESQNEIGLFVHTPDRCWTESGWKMASVQPEFKQLMVHGMPVLFERRVFSTGMQSELVYFAGLVGGQPLPYRLDHNLSIGMKHSLHLAKDATGTTLRASDERFWKRIWEAFRARRPLIGPKQFLRVSAPVLNGDVEQADTLIENFLPQWLALAPFDKEVTDWQASKQTGLPSPSATPAQSGKAP